MTEQPVVISDQDDGRAITAALLVLMGVPNTDEAFGVAFDRFAAAVGPGLPEFNQEQKSALFSRAGNLFWELVNEVPDTPGEQSAIGHSLQVIGTDDQDYHWREIIDAAARSAAASAAATGASNVALIQALQSGKLDIAEAFTQALADARYQRIGQGGGGTAIPPEFVMLQDVAVGADTTRNTINIGTRGNRTGNIVLSLSGTGLRMKAGSYLLTFAGLPDARSDRFNPLIGVYDGSQELSNSQPVYLRGTANEANTSWQCPLNLDQDVDVSFYARQGQVSTQGAGLTGSGAIRNILLMIQPVGGIKGDPGPAYVIGDELPWSEIALRPGGIDLDDFPSNFYLQVADKLTERTANSITVTVAGSQVLQLLASDSRFSDGFGQMNAAAGGGTVFQFSFAEAARDNIISNLRTSGAFFLPLDVVFSYTEGESTGYRLHVAIDSAVFARDNLSDEAPSALGSAAAAGSSMEVSRADHVHPLPAATTGLRLIARSSVLPTAGQSGVIAVTWTLARGVSGYTANSQELRTPSIPREGVIGFYAIAKVRGAETNRTFLAFGPGNLSGDQGGEVDWTLGALHFTTIAQRIDVSYKIDWNIPARIELFGDPNRALPANATVEIYEVKAY